MKRLAPILIASVRMVTLLTSVAYQQELVTKNYRSDELEIISEDLIENEIRLNYRVPVEKLYHSPGAALAHNDQQILLTLPRFRIDATAKAIDWVSVGNADGSRTIVIPDASDADMADFVDGCAAVVSCLGRHLSFKGGVRTSSEASY